MPHHETKKDQKETHQSLSPKKHEEEQSEKIHSSEGKKDDREKEEATVACSKSGPRTNARRTRSKQRFSLEGEVLREKAREKIEAQIEALKNKLAALRN